MIRAFVYRSGHVMVGTSVPDGAIELVAWDNESELDMVLRSACKNLIGDDGLPCLIFGEFRQYRDEMGCFTNGLGVRRRQLLSALQGLKSHPTGPAAFIAPSIERWSSEAIQMAGAA